jgi:poly(glycerol-phosphate) alpha-glucosyltransferase
MARTAKALPSGDLCALTWEIPDNFGGMTKSMLQRSCQLAAHFGRDIRVLTLAHQPDLDAVRADLVGRGLLVPGVTIQNLWEDLLVTPDADLASAPFDPSVSAPTLVSGTDGVLEVHRADGSVLARQQWVRMGSRHPLTPDGDQVTRTEIWASDGTFLGGWHGTWSWWRWWLGRVLEPGSSQVIVDSGYLADVLAVAPLPGVPTTYVVHNGHIAAERKAPYGRLERWRAYAHHHLTGFDAVVYLTETQLRHVQLLLGPQPHAHVVPHAIEPTKTIKGSSARPPGSGIVMANVDGRKRVDHAVRAVSAAAESVPDVELRVFGRGTGIEALEGVIEETDAPVTIEGYTPDPAAEFAASSYSLLTSTREGFGLVLVEAMAEGSLPISYDIPYGPADIIQDGVDGFLVPPGNTEAMADKIAEVATASRWRLRRLRRAARRRARSFSPPAVLPSWAVVLESAKAAAARRQSSEVDPAQLAEREHVAALYRLLDCRLEATLLDVSWAGSTATVTISCRVEGAGPLEGQPTVGAALVHVPSGARTAVTTRIIPSADDTPVAAPTATVAFDVDSASLAQPLHHVVLLTARLGPVEVSDTIVASASDRAWLDLPPAAPLRPVMVIDRRAGLRLVTASPHVAADIRLDADGAALLETAPLTSGTAAVEAVQATGMGGSPTVAASTIGPGSFELRLGEPGRWKLRAKVDGRWRNIAWRGPGNPPDPAGGLAVDLTAKGYVRLRRQA